MIDVSSGNYHTLIVTWDLSYTIWLKGFNELTKSLLDLIIVDCKHVTDESDPLAPVGTRDHCVVYCHLDLDVRSRSSFKCEIWDFENADYVGLNAAFSRAPFDVLYVLYNDIDDIV